MFKPKVNIVKQDDRVQVFDLTSTDAKHDFKARIYHYFNGVGEKLDLKNEAVIREVWKEQIKRHAESTGEVLVEEPEPVPEPKPEPAPLPEPEPAPANPPPLQSESNTAPSRVTPRPLGFEKK